MTGRWPSLSEMVVCVFSAIGTVGFAILAGLAIAWLSGKPLPRIVWP